MQVLEMKWGWIEGAVKTGYRSPEEMAAVRGYLSAYHKFPPYGFNKADKANIRRKYGLDGSYR